ncbi:hypothetical protein [Thalassotalea sp. G2M2-11]|uniref:hypothetical protein n=1 Tax=Thalassotalea sp. G2M2-11 TaxID=2787627 RepID=UPI0019D2B233|nr:hypothetical protein [Thalassotalea sp. G2M2-11]
MLYLSITLMMSLFVFTYPAYANKLSINSTDIQNPADSWTIWRESANKRVKTRSTKKAGLIEISAELTVNSSLSGFILFIQDQQNLANWLDKVKSFEVIAVSDNESLLSIRFKAFWPITERVMTVKSEVRQFDDLSVTISVTDLAKQNEQEDDAIVISLYAAQWHITPITKNTLHIRYQFIADANGSLPHWLTNRVTLSSIWSSLEKISQQLPQSKYQTLKHPIIEEKPEK